MGGYRQGSGRAKTGHYKGIYCGSTYELVWVIYQLDHSLPFQRFTGKLTDGTLTYVPDFLVGDKQIIEIKGYAKPGDVERKTALAESHGYSVTVLFKDDMKQMFDYVEQTYGTKKFAILYDDHKPRYTYTCTYCAEIFTRDFKLKSAETFCSREHVGKHRKATRPDKPITNFSNYKRKLTDEQAMAIFNAEGSYQKIADQYGLTKGAIGHIKSKRSYAWLHNDN